MIVLQHKFFARLHVTGCNFGNQQSCIVTFDNKSDGFDLDKVLVQAKQVLKNTFLDEVVNLSYLGVEEE